MVNMCPCYPRCQRQKFSIPGYFETYFQSRQTLSHLPLLKIASRLASRLSGSRLDYLAPRRLVTWGRPKFKLYHAAQVCPQETNCVCSTKIFSIAYPRAKISLRTMEFSYLELKTSSSWSLMTIYWDQLNPYIIPFLSPWHIFACIAASIDIKPRPHSFSNTEVTFARSLFPQVIPNAHHRPLNLSRLPNRRNHSRKSYRSAR